MKDEKGLHLQTLVHPSAFILPKVAVGLARWRAGGQAGS
jgi:hypothetical protein